MKEKEIKDVFKKLNISSKELPEYKNPYDFSQKLKKDIQPQFIETIYSGGSNFISGDYNNA